MKKVVFRKLREMSEKTLEKEETSKKEVKISSLNTKLNSKKKKVDK